MSWYHYDEGREQKERVREKIEALRKKGEAFDVVQAPTGTKIAKTFWGHNWCRHLESLSDYENRLPRGRSYLRQGNVYNLQITRGQITAQVTGSSLYDVAISIQPLTSSIWKDIKTDCAGQVGSLLDLLSGKLGDDVLRTVTDPDRGIFPKSREIRLNCSCPDYADLCKHAAAVLYAVAIRLDQQPDLFFTLRSVDPSELISSASESALSTPAADQALEGEDLSALFGIEMSESLEKTQTNATPEKLKKKRTPEGPPK